MPVIPTALDRRSDAFRANDLAMRALRRGFARQIGGDRARAATRPRASAIEGRGKLLARERVRLLLDPGSPFLELSRLRRLWHV